MYNCISIIILPVVRFSRYYRKPSGIPVKYVFVRVDNNTLSRLPAGYGRFDNLNFRNEFTMTFRQRLNLRVLLAEGTAFFLFIGIAAVIVAGYFPLRHQLITKKAIALLQKAGVDTCTIETVEIAAWKSVTIKNLRLVKRIDSLRAYTLSSEKIRCNINIVALFFNKNVFRDKLLAENTDLFKSLFSRPDTAYSHLFTLWQLLVRKGDTEFSDLRFSYLSGNREVVRGLNGTMTLQNDEQQPEAIEMELDVSIVNISGDGLQDVRCSATALPSGRVTLSNVGGRYFDGKIKGKAVIDVVQSSLESYECSIEKMDMAYWYTVHVGIGEVTGKATLRATGRDMPLRFPAPAADMQITLQQCKIANLPVQEALATSLFIPSLESIMFSRLTITAELHSGDTIPTTITANGDQLDFSSEGWVLADGHIHQKINGVFSKAMVDSFPPIVKKTLEPAPNGSRRLTCRLYGTYYDPLFELDEATMRRAVGNMFEEQRQQIMDILLGN
jgi:hypothetical protein